MTLAVLGVLLVAEHVHEGAVVDAVHAQRADEVPLHQPERLGEEQRVGRLGRHPVDDLAPELDGHGRVELPARQAVLGARGDGPARPRLREPQPLVVPLGQGHRGVEADDREVPGDVEDRLDHRLAHLGLEEVELGGVVPGHARAVVAVVDVARRARPVVDALEDDGGVGPVVVAVLDPDARRARPRRGPAR